jgi:aspartate aminotransferase-like enzyme
MIHEQQLRVPGPTPLPARVLAASSRQMINHRGPEFADLLTEVTEGLQWAYRTGNDILIFPASGTGGLEAAVVNLLSPGEKALFCVMGAFGKRWADIAAGYGVDVVRHEVPYGQPIDPEDVEAILAANPEINVVFVTHNETSTGVTNEIPAIAAVVKGRGKLIAVDSVSGAGCLPLDTDGLKLDVVVSGSQKGWMSPPGVTMVAVSADAFAKAETAKIPRWYFDFARERSYQAKKQTYTTPAISVLYAMREGLAMMREEGLENVWARHERCGEMIRAGVDAVGLRLFAADGYRSNTVTAVQSPTEDAADLKKLLGHLRTEYGLVLAGGQGDLQGKIFRIGHLGMIDERDVYSILATLEQGLVDNEMLSRVGLCVAAAQAVARRGSDRAQPAGVG